MMLDHLPDDGREWRSVSKLIDGEPFFSMLGLSILTGWSEAALSEYCGEHDTVPAHAMKAGKRRASEAAAAVGSRDLDACLPYLAAGMGYELANLSAFEILAAPKAVVA